MGTINTSSTAACVELFEFLVSVGAHEKFVSLLNLHLASKGRYAEEDLLVALRRLAREFVSEGKLMSFKLTDRAVHLIASWREVAEPDEG